MKKFVAAAAFAAFATSPAFAAKITVEFAQDGGDTTIVVFDDEANTATSNGNTGPYTMDPEAKKLCGADADGELCITFDTLSETPEVGFSTAYTSSRGTSGTATITAVE